MMQAIQTLPYTMNRVVFNGSKASLSAKVGGLVGATLWSLIPVALIATPLVFYDNVISKGLWALTRTSMIGTSPETQQFAFRCFKVIHSLGKLCRGAVLIRMGVNKFKDNCKLSNSLKFHLPMFMTSIGIASLGVFDVISGVLEGVSMATAEPSKCRGLYIIGPNIHGGSPFVNPEEQCLMSSAKVDSVEEFCQVLKERTAQAGPLDLLILNGHTTESQQMELSESYKFNGWLIDEKECMLAALKERAQVILLGCNTAVESGNKLQQSMAQKLAVALPNREVTGIANTLIMPLFSSEFEGDQLRINFPVRSIIGRSLFERAAADTIGRGLMEPIKSLENLVVSYLCAPPVGQENLAWHQRLCNTAVKVERAPLPGESILPIVMQAVASVGAVFLGFLSLQLQKSQKWKSLYKNTHKSGAAVVNVR